MIEEVKQGVIAGLGEGLKNCFISFFKWIGLGVVNQSYWVCLTICIVAVFLYLAGKKKAGKYIPISFITFYILQCLKPFLK